MIWCVEDDQGIREIILYTLKSTGFEARGFGDGRSFFGALRTALPELVVLDIMLPDEDGVSILRRLRQAPETAELPVIMATAKGMEYDKIQSLDLGADDYLVKPFGMMELVSRIRAVLRRYKREEAQTLALHGLTMNLTERSVHLDEKKIPLTYKEFELLRLFLARPGMAFTREQLFSQVWGESFIGESRTVDMHIRTLRQKLGSWGDRIETIRNVGYRLEGGSHDR